MQDTAMMTTVLSSDAALAYRRYVESHYGVIDPIELAQVMFNAGGRTALAASVAFGDIIPRLRFLEQRIGTLADVLAGS